MKQTYPEFLEDTENFIFVESKPEQADIIFCSGKRLSADGRTGSQAV